MGRCKCGVRIWKGYRCASCKDKALERDYGLSFRGGTAKPSEKFWAAWRKNSDAVKRRGLRPEKTSQGWLVHKAQRMM